MLNINFYITVDDDGQEKYIITIDGKKAAIDGMSADELGNLIKMALEASIGG